MNHFVFRHLSGQDKLEDIWKCRKKATSQTRGSKLALIRYIRYMHKYNAGIHSMAIFKSMPIFPHGLNGIFVSKGAKIGKNCVIFHQVTIGSNTLYGSKHCGVPTIGNNVYIGCGAKIIGGITIGDNVVIGANCIVTENVPSGSTVVLQKPRVIQREINRNIEFVSYDKWEEQQLDGRG